MGPRHLLVIALIPFTSGAARATNYCVSNGTQLNSALVSAASNGQPDLIRLMAGNYVFPGTGGGTFKYLPTASEDFDIEISGGWTYAGAHACGQLPDSTRAIDTIITTGSSNPLMSISLRSGSMDATVRRVTFLGGDGNATDTGGLKIPSQTGHTGTILVDQCAFIANEGGYASALYISTRSGTIRVRNSLFLENDTSTNTTVGLADLEGGSGGIYFTNNTVIGNTNSAGGNGASGAYVFATALAQAFVANNNLWNNDNGDLFLGGDGYTYLRNNNVQTLFGAADESSGNISFPPAYQGGYLNYTPADGSPLIDAGILPETAIPTPVPFDQAWGTGAFDVFTRNRTQGIKIDIGAYESDFDTSEDVLFADGFE